MMIDLVWPCLFVPIHGEYRMLVAHARSADAVGVSRIVIVEDGDIVELREGERVAFTGQRASAGRIYFDTWLSEGVAEVMLRDRQLLADSGLLVYLCLVDHKTGAMV